MNTFTFGLPPDQDPAQRISVVFVLDNGDFSDAIQGAVRDFINQMVVGDYAAIVKTRYSSDPDLNVQVVQPFTQIDGGTGTSTLIDFVTVVSREGFPKSLNSLMLAVDQFETLPVASPNGPKAIILVGRGRFDLSTQSLSDVVSRANENSIPIFVVETGDNSVAPQATARMTSLAADTGGTHFAAPNEANVAQAYGTLTSLLNNAYRLTIPQTAANDCDLHMLEVTALGQSMSSPFARCDTTPDRFGFTDQINVATGSVVVSDPVMITSIESPTSISVIGGEYSIGCVATFTTSGFILPNEEVCVRHTTSASVLTSTSTTLTVGGESAMFTSTTSAAPPPPPAGGGGGGGVGNGGGGGSTGLFELLLALGALFARKGRRL